MTKQIKFDLEDRLIDFSVLMIQIIEQVKKSKAGNLLTSQLIRSETSPALNYGEAQSGESHKDFIHKMKVSLKELRETRVCLKIIKRGKLTKNISLLNQILNENNELIAIFVKSIQTASGNQRSQ